MCRLRSFAGLLGMLLVGGCYSPNIPQGAFTCGPGGACPASYHCVAANNRCYSVADASIDVPCKSVTTAPQVCSASPVGGQACNPGCQTGCNGCGWCGVVNGAASCLQGTAGTKDIGDLCNPSNSQDCKAGLYCQPECGKGRCYQLCDPLVKDNCSAPSTCSQAIAPAGTMTLPFKLCSLVVSCDPVSQASTTCPAPFACYPTGNGALTECDCPGATPDGQPCINLADCQSGSSCNGTRTGSLCLPTCALANSQCAAGSTCNPVGSTYGYCM
jgi:hypothetical protein